METKEFVVTVRRRQFDEIAYRMISENEIYGIIDFSVEEQANDVLVSYQNEAYVPLPVYFERELTRAEILRIFENYFAIMDGMAGFLLDEHQLLLDCRQIYIDPESGELRLIYLPDLACEEEVSIAEFIRQILFLVRYDPNEDSSYIVRIMNELNARTEFDSKRQAGTCRAGRCLSASGEYKRKNTSAGCGAGDGKRPATVRLLYRRESGREQKTCPIGKTGWGMESDRFKFTQWYL